MNPLALLGASTKAGLSRKLPFAPNLSSGGYQTHYLPGLSAINPTDPQHFPDPLTNTVVAACVNAIAQALPDAPPVLEQRQTDGTWKRLPSHPLLDLLNFPNPYHSTSDIWALTVAQEATRGEAFWILSFDNTTPREIWVWPTEKVTVEGTAAQPISGYTVYGETGAPVRLQNHEVIHFRHRPAIANWRRGEAPLLTGTRQIAADNAAASYHSAILRNAGVLSLLISLKDSASAGEVTPGQLQEYLDKLKRKLTGDGAGAIAGLDLPLDVHKIGYSPDEMALDKLVNYYESRICALMGVDPMVCGLGSGTLQKTYANLSEALNDFWERQIIPLLRRHASTLTAQLFPSFGLSPTDYRLTFDTTQVPALQENLDALFTRWRELYSSGGCDLYTLQSQIGLPDVPPEYKGQFAKLPQQEDSDPNGTKMIDANGMSHDELGRFDGGIGGFGRQLYHFPPQGVLPGIDMARPVQKGHFESLCSWEEMNRVSGRWPELESPDYQAAKAQGIRELLPFTSWASDENARVILRDGGNIVTRNQGTSVRVSARVPWSRKGAIEHTHNYEGCHSNADWSHLLIYEEEEQSHILTSKSIYSLHKPQGWNPYDYNIFPAKEFESPTSIVLARSQIELECQRIGEQWMKTREVGEPGWEAAVSHHISMEMARRYNIIFRIGTLKKGENKMEQKNLENDVQSETVNFENAEGDFVEKVSLVKPGVFDQERFDRMRKINPDFGHGLYLGGDPYIRKIREAIAHAKAHPVEGEDEKMAARRVHEWVVSQLPRIHEELQGETLRGDYLA